MKRIIALIIILFVGAGLARSAISQETPAWLPINKSEFIKLYAEKLNLPLKEPKPLDVWLTAKRLELRSKPGQLRGVEAYFANSRNFITPGETLWLPGGGHEDNIQFALVGRGDRIHSFRVVVGEVNMFRDEGKKTKSFLSALFQKIYPNWPEATQWPLKSLKESWKISERLMRGDRSIPPNDSFIRTRREGITSSTFGVVPDVVIYSITVRQNCIPTLALGEPFRRAIC